MSVSITVVLMKSYFSLLWYQMLTPSSLFMQLCSVAEVAVAVVANVVDVMPAATSVMLAALSCCVYCS